MIHCHVVLGITGIRNSCMDWVTGSYWLPTVCKISQSAVVNQGWGQQLSCDPTGALISAKPSA